MLLNLHRNLCFSSSDLLVFRLVSLLAGTSMFNAQRSASNRSPLASFLRSPFHSKFFESLHSPALTPFFPFSPIAPSFDCKFGRVPFSVTCTYSQLNHSAKPRRQSTLAIVVNGSSVSDAQIVKVFHYNCDVIKHGTLHISLRQNRERKDIGIMM